MKHQNALFKSGTFFTGCNYWASHAGTNMWNDWNPRAVDEDFERLAQSHIRVLRIFPLWSDFQPIRMHYAGQGAEAEIRLREDPLPFTEAGRAGVDIVMADRFETVCDLAKKHGLLLVVGLVTGWMSGRLHVPEALQGRNILTDPVCIRWQLKFIHYMVKRFRDHEAIAAWDLGNECNCLGKVESRDQAYVWASALADRIKADDSEHLLVSGMHGLNPTGAWTPQDQGELTDILCTHPYPIFTEHCDCDPINEMKTVLHATAESVMYASLGGKPCFVEEAGTLGPMIADEQTAADYIRASMFSSWAHDLRGFMWWCANEQSMLSHTPYDWCAVERELGLFRADGSKKPVLEEMTAFTDYVDRFEYQVLSPRLTDAVCVLTKDQDTWGCAYGSFILAKQAGLDISFAWCEDQIPEACNYLMPSLSGLNSVSRHALQEILSRVRSGAKLYLSLNDALLSPFCEITGIRVKTRSRRKEKDIVTMDGVSYEALWSSHKYVYENAGADILAQDQDGRPAFTEYEYGEGKIYFLVFPAELGIARDSGLVSGESAVPYYRFYEKMDFRNPEKCARSSSPYITVTEHIQDEGTRILTLLNHTPAELTAEIMLDGYVYDRLIDYRGAVAAADENGFFVTLPGNTGTVSVIVKR